MAGSEYVLPCILVDVVEVIVTLRQGTGPVPIGLYLSKFECALQFFDRKMIINVLWYSRKNIVQ